MLEVLQRVRALVPGLSAEVTRQVEAEVRAEYGGLRVRIPKRKKHMSAEERGAVYEQGLGAAPTPEIVGNAGIHRATLYRLMKRGGSGSAR